MEPKEEVIKQTCHTSNQDLNKVGELFTVTLYFKLVKKITGVLDKHTAYILSFLTS